MRHTIRLVVVLVAVLAIATGLLFKFRGRSSGAISKDNGLVVHEWGTFTSIAGKDGVALEWRPLNGSADLPKFVHTMRQEALGLRHPRTKGDLTAAIRMETPVIYFYSGREMNVSARVDFPKGKITEWFPQARTVGSSINWGMLKVSPGAVFNLPAEYSNNHYYAARETDASPVQICGTSGRPIEQEKFLFYRGVGTFDLPLNVKVDGNSLVLRNAGKDQIARVFIFENRGGQIGYRVVENLSGEVLAERPVLDKKNVDALVSELKQTLVASGLYEKEAEAMIKTWSNSWFEEGARVFYILPQSITDEVLPISIDPKPSELVRVLVGRAELITPEMEKSIEHAVKLLSDSSNQTRQQALSDIKKYGRFSEPVLRRLLADERDPLIRTQIKRLLENSNG